MAVHLGTGNKLPVKAISTVCIYVDVILGNVM